MNTSQNNDFQAILDTMIEHYGIPGTGFYSLSSGIAEKV